MRKTIFQMKLFLALVALACQAASHSLGAPLILEIPEAQEAQGVAAATPFYDYYNPEVYQFLPTRNYYGG
jgi:hypothetical protein